MIFRGKFAVPIEWRLLPFRVMNDVLIFCMLTGIAYARETAQRAARAETLRARASLEALRSQLNPHFIFNTFHALVGLVRRDPAIAESGLEKLGDLLRYSLRVHRDGIDEVPLREELAFVESYLQLEHLRLGDRLRMRVDAPEATLEYLVPTFAVQILVENAIRHAIAPRAAGGFLDVRADEADGRLRIAVQDEGDGEAIAERFEGSRMGLRLLQDRLTALYRGGASLELRSVERGTRAELQLPVRPRGEDES
jgi:LytS/YehU family sensor histidine kinase